MSNFNNAQLIKILGNHESLMNVYQNHGENGLRHLIGELGINPTYAMTNNIFELGKILTMFEIEIVENAIEKCINFKMGDIPTITRIIENVKYELVNVENDDHVGGNDWGAIREWVNDCIQSGTHPHSIIRLA